MHSPPTSPVGVPAWCRLWLHARAMRKLRVFFSDRVAGEDRIAP